MTESALSRRVLVFYALPGFAVALPTIPVFIHLPRLYGAELGLGLAATGMVLLLARLFDTVTDPLIGILSDRLRFRGSRRKPWIAIGAVIGGAGLYKLLNPPTDPGTVYLLGSSLLLYAGWTMVSVPYLAWGAELSDQYDARTRITAWRESFSLLGILGAGAIGATATGAGWTERESISAIACATIAFGAIAIPLLLWQVSDHAPRERHLPDWKRRSIRRRIESLASNKPFLRLLGAWFANGLANGIPAALFFFYLEHRLGADADARANFVLLYFLAAVAAMPLWTGLSRRYGKHRVWCGAMIAACCAFLTVPLLGEGDFVAFAAVCIVTGMALGADLALPPAIQADVVDYDTLRNGRSRAGLQFAFWGMATKLALAVAVGLALPGVEVFGFDPAAPTEKGITAVMVIYALLPVVIKTVAIAAMWRFPLTADRHAVIRRRLEGRGTAEEIQT